MKICPGLISASLDAYECIITISEVLAIIGQSGEIVTLLEVLMQLLNSELKLTEPITAGPSEKVHLL